MKLNKPQRYALLLWLGSKVQGIIHDHSVISQYDEFCDGDIPEWRIISNFGMAGKIWNVHDSIYVTGYSCCEISKQQKLIEAWNKEIKELLLIYS